MKLGKTFLVGLIAGSLLTLGLSLLIKKIAPPVTGNNILAKVQGQALTQKELRKQVGTYLIPIENDEYAILRWGVDEWIQNRLLEKEAKAEGVGVEELYRKEVWSKVNVSYENVQDYYNKNKELFPDGFNTAHPILTQQLRHIEYAKLKDQYLTELRKKYDVKDHLKPPQSFVEGLALPAGALPADQAPTPAPSVGAVEIRSVAGNPPAKGPSDAIITMTEFADFHCAFCKQVAATLGKVFANYPGKIQFIFRNYPLSKKPGTGSFLTHEAAVCAQEQGKFWEYHDAIFALAESPQEADLQTLAKNVGLDEAKFQDCLKTGRTRSAIEEDIKEGDRRGVQGTPMIFLNDQTVEGAYPYEHFVSVIEGILDPTKAKAAPPSPASIPPTPPSIVQFNDLEGRPTRGPKEAPVTLVEFSDFYCPFCQRVEPTLEDLEKNYAGKIRRVWRHYPLPFHTGADRVHEASECAHEQGKFWPYHKKLFEKQGTPFDDNALIKLAGDLDLNKKKFEKCLKSGKYKELVQKDLSRGTESGVQGTPAVFVNGQLVSGAQPYAAFDQIVKSELNKS